MPDLHSQDSPHLGVKMRRRPFKTQLRIGNGIVDFSILRAGFVASQAPHSEVALGLRASDFDPQSDPMNFQAVVRLVGAPVFAYLDSVISSNGASASHSFSLGNPPLLSFDPDSSHRFHHSHPRRTVLLGFENASSCSPSYSTTLVPTFGECNWFMSVCICWRYALPTTVTRHSASTSLQLAS